MPSTFKKQFNWSLQFNPKIKDIVKGLAGKIITVRDATPKEDMTQSTDLVIEVDVGTIAARVRKKNCPFSKYKDVTIRSYNKGYKTEIHKIKEGWGSWYIYAWNEFNNWIFYDIDRVRNTGLLNKEFPEMSNYDGTKFISIPVMDLQLIRAIVDCSKEVKEYIN
ncbi:MAG: hypothetical protein K9K32_05745 [Halanaerobiales bacterium]|nr:hypothetical protein [Halanaerobiales bacterium]